MDKDNILRLCNNNSNTLMETLGIIFVDMGDDFVTAKMPVNSKVYQPNGILHGGATVALAETVGSFASYFFNKDKNLSVRGIEISANHLKSVSEGLVYATARPIKIGKSIQLWEIKVVNDKNELISLCKLTTYSKTIKNK
ncbi:MAG: thioesterase [Flavobacteriaceae bacterium]|nr:thioesterase [Flavobacteriaceae bacterium]|tara:strand:+ start:6659 stop:7078 length:420 start_codon:yes stop_codon:yes gene_type:complete